MVKKGDSSFNVIFKDGAYTNKLFARNIAITPTEGGDILEVDFSHYSKKKRNNLEDSDFDRLVKQQGEISHFLSTDTTVQSAIQAAKVSKVVVKLADASSVSVTVSSFDSSSGLLR